MHTANNGRVYVFSENLKNIKYYDSECVQVLANLARMDNNFNGSPSNVKKLLHCIRDYKPNFELDIQRKHLNKSYIVKGVMINERIISQNGDFIIFGIGNGKQEPSEIVQLNDTVIIINGENKANIIEELSLFNITEGTVYPELNKKLKVIKNQWISKHKKIENENYWGEMLQDIDLSSLGLEDFGTDEETI